MRLTFEDHLDLNGRNIGRPIIPITLEKSGIQAHTWAKIDSGAEVSLFDSEIAEEMNLVPTEGAPVTLRGIGGHELAYAHIVTLTVSSGDETVALPCRVLFKENVIQNLLGLEDFFEVFRITFARYEGYIQLDPVIIAGD